jgi:type VI secretion system protein ImpK
MTGVSPASAAPPTGDRLALVFQDLLTAVVRIQARREQVENLEDFRNQVLGAVASAREQARAVGYSEDHIRWAVFAVIAFLDEAALKSANPVFREWARSPMHNRLFKSGHVAGDTFFEYVRDLLIGDNSSATADVLEIYLLCLLLGYRGRYGEGNEGNLRAIEEKIAAKLQGIRGAAPLFAPSALPPPAEAPPERDRLTTVLVWTAVATMLLSLVLLFAFRSSLSSSLGAGIAHHVGAAAV